ncbi:MAG: hypothetical protein AB7E84_12065 [Xanthobacteraceae bacterium]
MRASRNLTVAPKIAANKAKGRSKTSNHQDYLPGLDGRSSAARRFRDLVNAFVIDQGGIENCSEIKFGLLRRLAAATVQSELLEARMVNGEQVDVATLCTLASTTVRISSRLGIERVPKEVDVIDPLKYAAQQHEDAVA